ncbi:MAG: cob(I)yrinic acid a,c-diamide adenosyltransferase [Armatimonadia bacterium]|nr:cob(I)yrinic acid a,c-diamide adenosyltransferase [Armatimonadia bacterium]
MPGTHQPAAHRRGRHRSGVSGVTEWKRGYVQVYTGDGKGKTTAALGLALRVAGAGLRVFIAQFVKGMEYSELRALEQFDEIEVRRYGRGCFIRKEPSPEDIEAAHAGLAEAREELLSGDWDLVILDEANIAIFFDLFSVEDLLEVIAEKPEGVELVITGRRADPRVIEAADLVTEMREVKHYYEQGVQARKGIEN